VNTTSLQNNINHFRKTKHKLYKHALLDSGAELTVTNDKSLFIEDSLEYLDENFNFNIVSVDGGNTKITAIGIMTLNVYANDDTTIEVRMVAAYIDNIYIGTIISESDLIQNAMCDLHKIADGDYFLELDDGSKTFRIMLPRSNKLTYIELIRPEKESEYILMAICSKTYQWYHLLKQRIMSDVCVGTPRHIDRCTDIALNDKPNHGATALKQYAWKVNSISINKYWDNISSIANLKDGNIPGPEVSRPSPNEKSLTLNSNINSTTNLTGTKNITTIDNITECNRCQLVEDAPLDNCKKIAGYDIMCYNDMLKNEMACFTCGVMNTELLNWSVLNYKDVDDIQHQAQYLHDVSGHMSADHLISAIESGSVQGVNLTSTLKDAIKMHKCEHCFARLSRLLKTSHPFFFSLIRNSASDKKKVSLFYT